MRKYRLDYSTKPYHLREAHKLLLFVKDIVRRLLLTIPSRFLLSDSDYLVAIFYADRPRINDHGRASRALRAKNETQRLEMTRPKSKSRGGPTRSPRGKFPIYSSSLPNTWEPIKRMNGIVAVAAMLRAALGVHEIRAHRSLSLSPSFLSSSFTFCLSLSPSFWTSPAPSCPPTRAVALGFPLLVCPPMRSLPPHCSSRIETPLCRVASGITMNLHSLASNSEHIAQLWFMRNIC